MPPNLTAWFSLWNWEPSVLGLAAFIVSVYLGVSGPLRGRFLNSRRVERTQMAWFLLGVLVFLIALVSPLDTLSDCCLFSAHMTQHVLLTLVVPPLLLLGTPGWFLGPILRRPFWKRSAQILTNPLLAFLLFNATFLAWHAPAAYEATLHNTFIHVIEHTSFLGTATLFWWPILSPLPELPRMPFPAQVLYLFLAAVPSTILGALIVFSPDILYQTYANAPRITSLSPMADQQIAGLVMAMFNVMIYLGALGAVFFTWLEAESA